MTIGDGVLARADDHLPELPDATTAFVVSDREVSDVYFSPLAEAIGRGLAAVLLLAPAGRRRNPSGATRASCGSSPAGGASTRPDRGARRARSATSRGSWRPRTCGGAVRAGPHHAHGPGGRRDRREDRREPARGQEPRGDVRATSRPCSPTGHAPHARGPRLPVGPGGGGQVRAHARRRAPDPPRGRSGAGRGAGPRRDGGRGRSMRRPRRGSSRRTSGTRRPAGPELRAHARARAGAAGRVPRSHARRGDRGGDGLRRLARGAAGLAVGLTDRTIRLLRALGLEPRQPALRSRTSSAPSASTRSTAVGEFVLLEDVGRPSWSTTSRGRGRSGPARDRAPA